MRIASHGSLSDKHYLLVFDNSFSWKFLSTKKAKNFLEEFSNILQLTQVDSLDQKLKNSYLVIFCDLSELTDLGIDLSDDYIVYKQGTAYKIIENKNNRFFLVGMNMELFREEEIKYITMSAASKIIYKHAVINKKAIPIHAASLQYKNKGLLIIAPGGTGKSTIYRNCKSRSTWAALADDNALLFDGEEIKLYPMPTWSDYIMRKSKTYFKVSEGIILKKIFFLEQSQNDEITEISLTGAMKRIISASSETYGGLMTKLDEKDTRTIRLNTLNFAMSLIKKVKCSILKATLSDNPIKLIERDIEDT